MNRENRRFLNPLRRQGFYLRISFFVAFILCIALGLASRRFAEVLPSFVSLHAGDALWAMMVYFGFRFLLVEKPLYSAIGCAVLFSFGIELSQLYQADWINVLRSTVPGSLVLGHGFLIVDLFRYAAGIVAGVLLEKIFLPKLMQ
ncbi:Protein of unknown function [Planococcus glaciei]|uniref:ribosomal maturation YjgA family protein n=1 Tax=Planococcus glaciei TaxID=459472 RepID=UPI0008906D16|nr:DUF2809 domain-containing protein [Planococcus glaciei]SDH80742.1 Protein of unknown function [Planococcus glaciei]